uniref:ABC transporter domain-containing protein n=1 Tax=Macrostomum lignano TaxID=282301 RepID=A0A1I8GAF8_9PLAT
MSDEKAADDSSSTFSQAIHLLRLMLRLKLWKFLFWILLIPTLFLNFLIMQRLEKKNPDTVSGPSVKSLSAAEAANWKVLIARQAAIEAGTLKAIAQNRGVKSGSSWLTRCGETEACQIDFMESIVSLSDATRAFMKFERRVTEFYCLDGSRSDLICSYLFHLMHQSMDSGGATAASVFKDVNFIKLYDRFESETMKREWLKAKIDAPDSLCTRSAKNSGAFFDYFPRYFMLHLLVVASAMTLYFTVSTLSGVAGLKENGFLQLMFCNGLSVAAYWIVVWLITLAELLTMSALFVISYGIQCPGFFSPEGLFKSFLTLLCFFVLLASLGLLVTTIAGNHVAGAMVMLVFPPGNIVEYLLEAMLPKSPANRRPTGYEPYYQSIEVLLSVLPIIFIILTIYLDFVVKNGNGLCLPFMYPFNPSFWNPHRQKLIEMVDEQPKRANVEPTVGVPAVIADDIHLTYPSGCCEAKKPPVLKGITCTVYQGQITALIGHNGAGKTTLIRVLMGEEIPSRGVAVINGHRVTDPYQRLALRGSVSICKQVDVLSNYLTVMESMKLTLVAKGFSPDSQVAKVLDMMKRLGLAGKENVQAMDLSGGQMRKVCSIICLLGNPKLVILDEPTSGLDPVSRRNLWQILQDHKAGRSIILCTQFMDEADILADRKVFLSAGKIICAGSSMFLKNAFGCCVSINVSLKSVEFARPLVKCLKKVKLVSQMHTELLLNVSADKPQFLADAIQVLEEHKEWVEAFGVSQAQLDTIFMRLRHIDLENIEASFRSKKLRKVGRAERAEAAVVPAVPRSNAPNLTIKRAYTFDTFESFEFTKSYELLMFITAFSIVPITYLNDPIEDRDCGVRQQLRSMGMRSLAYWLNNFILHWTHYMIYFLLCLHGVDRYQSQFFFVNVCLPVLIFGTASCLLSVYVVSALMKKSNPVVIVSCFFFALFLGVVANIAQNSSTAMLILICFLPQFTPVAYILLSVKLMIYSLYFLEVKNPDNVLNLANLHLSNSNILVSLIAMPVHCVLLVLLLILAENPAGIKLAFKKPDLEKGSELEKTIKDTGVPLEAERINKTPRNPLNMLEVRDLQKIYPNGVHAVRGTTFGSFSGEILGLLGPNGAGKTTSMSIIVGEEASSSGTSEVHFGGTWMSGIDGARCGAIGYCPQHNPLFNSISVFEHLRFYAQIRGIPDQLGSAQIAGLIEGLGLKPHQHKAAEQLSGGNKRRLCLAIALLGNPSLVVIDEASTGVDPENKRFIWGAIRGMANKQRSVMITTHSMEEVEALCARVGIMNKGLMIGFGTVQQLRSRHGEAYTLDVLMQAKTASKLAVKKRKLTKMILKQFKGAVVMEDLLRCMQFVIPRSAVKIFSEAIRLILLKKKKMGIRTFCLYQMSLDQVFVKLVKEHDDT